MMQTQILQLKQKYQNEKKKYDNQIKKNSNLLKMNSNLMRDNEIYQNCFMVLKKWKLSLSFNEHKSQTSQMIENLDQYPQNQDDQSIIDIQEEGQEFIRTLIQDVENRLGMHSFHSTSKLHTETQMLEKESEIVFKKDKNQLEKQCENCSRWKGMYTKESQQTTRLQQLFNDSTFLTTQKQLSFVKLKDDIFKMLEDYWALYRKQFRNIHTFPQQITQQTYKKLQAQTVRIQTNLNFSVQQKVNSNNSKDKNPQTNRKPSKNKTSRDNKYTIDLKKSKSPLKSKSIHNQPHNNRQNQQMQKQFQRMMEQINKVMKSMSEINGNLEKQNQLLKEQMRDFNQILMIYREKERNRILYR